MSSVVIDGVEWTVEGAQVAIVERGRVLLQFRPWPPGWELPGGHCEPGEDPAVTAAREVEEESGYKVRIAGIVGVYSWRGLRSAGDVVFLGQVIGGAPRRSLEAWALRIASSPAGDDPSCARLCDRVAAYPGRPAAGAPVITALLFLASLILVVVASELFTNAIEWAGYLLNLGTGATGSLLAALGTSLPETVVPIVALATHSTGANLVATGAVLGSPFLLLTLGAGATGVAVVLRGGARRLVIDPLQARRDLGVFLGAFTVAVLSSLLPNGARIAVGALLLITYAAYVVVTLRSSAAAGESPEPLHIVRWRPGEPHPVLVSVQLVIAVGLLVLGSQLFVTALDRTASALAIPILVLSLVVVPIATELPETLNSVLWVRTNDDALAFGNVAGSATFQSCVLGALGVVFTTWQPGAAGYISASLTVLTAAFLLALLWRGKAHGGHLMLVLVPWIVYVVAQVVTGGRLAL